MTNEIQLPTGTIIIFDTEYTTFPGAQENGWSKPDEHRELVQLVAQRINVDTQEVLGEFSAFAKPRINGQLSQTFIDLTHITQDVIEIEGKDFPEVYESFVAWAGTDPIYSYGSSKTSDGQILEENIQLYGLDLAYNDSQYFNLRPMFAEAGVAVENYTSGELFKAFDLELTGHVHNAMHDVNSLVQSLFALQKQLST